MANLRLDINIDDITKDLKEFQDQLSIDVQKEAEGLAIMTNAKLHELATDKLKSLAKKYKDNIEFDNPEPNLWIVTLKEPAMWIEEGRESGSMLPSLLKNNPHISSEGKKYKVIPFEHSKPPSEQTVKAQSLANTVKDELKKQGIGWKKIEYNSDGSPRTGLIHKINIPSEKPTDKSKFPALHGVSIYQSKQVGGGVRRDVLTFRVAHEDHEKEGKWFYPGRDGDHLMDEVFEWASKTWENDILPSVLGKYK
jgi:hypothetical protein